MSVQSMCSGEAALVPASLRGYRMWNASGSALVATSLAHGEWVDGHLSAECKSWNGYQHDAPDSRCGCGIYGWYRPDEVRLHRGAIFGVIEASGRVLLGDFGFRAQHARVLALVMPGDDVVARDFRSVWAARGVAMFPDRDALVAQYPPDDVAELLGHEIPDTVPVDAQFGISVREFQRALSAFGRAMDANAAVIHDLMRAAKVDPPERQDRTVQDRALALRRNRNTGPAREPFLRRRR